YTNQDAKYFFVGNLVDIKQQKNMTEERIAELGKIDVKSLPLNQAIKYVKGKGERTLYIFSDPDCPYCQRLEQNMVGVDNVTV
ncbi:DsbC family protein, partial [Klebsiella pneumoniae]